MKNTSVPVFMYHSVGIPNKRWLWSELTIPYKTFENQLRFLKKKGYNTVLLSDLYNFIKHGKSLPPKSIILTFDDGYADNYVFAYPLLKKYGFKGTIFVNPEFVDPRRNKRKIFNDSCSLEGIHATGFLSWEEMVEMESDGIIDIQSHALTHTWYPVSDKIIDFRHPGDKYLWMTWNENKAKKPFLQFDDCDLIKLGMPVYENEKSLLARRFMPDEKLSEHLIDYVDKNGKKLFFGKKDWKKDLFRQVDLFLSNNDTCGIFETDNEHRMRIKFELEESKRVLEENLNKKIEFLCWPGGSGSREGHEIAIELGYKMTTAAKDIPSQQRKEIKNDGEVFPDRIGRTSPILIQKQKNYATVPVYCDGPGLWLRVKSFSTYGYTQKLFKVIIQAYGSLLNILN